MVTEATVILSAFPFLPNKLLCSVVGADLWMRNVSCLKISNKIKK